MPPPSRRRRNAKTPGDKLASADTISERKTVIQEQPLQLENVRQAQIRFARQMRGRTRRRKANSRKKRAANPTLASAAADEFFTSSASEESAFSVAFPFQAFEMGLRPACPYTSESRGLSRIATVQSYPIQAISVGANTWAALVVLQPYLTSQYNQCTAFGSSINPTAFGTMYNNPALSSIIADEGRVTHMGYEIRNLTPVANIAGESLYGLVPNQEATSSSFTTYGTLSSKYRHAEVPGDIGMMFWRGDYSNGLDYQLVPPTTSASSSGNSTAMIWFYYGVSTVQPVFQMDVVTFYEFIPTATAQSLWQPQRKFVNLTHVERKLCELFEKNPPYTTPVCVRKDDGFWGFFKDAVNSVFSTVDKVVDYGKKGWNVISQIGDVASSVSSIFGMDLRIHQLALHGIEIQADYKDFSAAVSRCDSFEELSHLMDLRIQQELARRRLSKLRSDGTLTLLAQAIRDTPYNTPSDDGLDRYGRLIQSPNPSNDRSLSQPPPRK